MKDILLMLPVKGASEIYDEQGIALIASYLRINGYKVIMETIKEIKDIELLDLQEISVVGITAYHDNLPFVFQICDQIKKRNRNLIICLGGYSATYYADEILKQCKDIDFIIEREGETTFLEICHRIKNGEELSNQKGIFYRDDEDNVIYTGLQNIIKNLSDMPCSAKDIFEKHNLNLVEISTSRGCLNNCSFCYSHSYFDPTGNIKWRGRSAQNVVEEIENILHKYKVSKFYFNNASFEDSIPYKKFMIDFCNEIVKNGLTISFCVNFRANFFKHCNNEEMRLLIKAGLTGVFLGVEAFNSEDLKIYNKHITVEENLESIKFFHQQGNRILWQES